MLACGYFDRYNGHSYCRTEGGGSGQVETFGYCHHHQGISLLPILINANGLFVGIVVDFLGRCWCE